MREMQQGEVCDQRAVDPGEEAEGMGRQRRPAEGGRQMEGEGGRRGGTWESKEGYVIGGLGITRSCVEGGREEDVGGCGEEERRQREGDVGRGWEKTREEGVCDRRAGDH